MSIEEKRKRQREHYHLKKAENPEKINDYQRRWRAANPERRRKYVRTWLEKNREKLKHKFARLKREIIDAYGGKCVCCGEQAYEFLTIDHINGRPPRRERGKTRGNHMYADLKKAGFPKDEFRLLCMNCNFSRGMYGYCPHQKREPIS